MMFRKSQEINDEVRQLRERCMAIEDVLTEAYSKIGRFDPGIQGLEGAEGISQEAVKAKVDEAKVALSGAIFATHQVVFGLNNWKL
jgi:hypothetical protein